MMFKATSGPIGCIAAVIAFIACMTLWQSPAIAGTTGAIQGVVADSSGKPLAGAHVSVSSPTFSTSTVTGPNGFYAVNGLPVDTYRVAFSAEGFQAQIIVGVTVVQDQSVRIDGRLAALEIKTLAKIAVRGQTSVIQPTQTADTYTINESTLENINGTPQDLNGFQAFNSLPGVTTDNAGYPIIRAGAENDVGYEYEGVDNTDPVTGQFLNGLSLNGARSIQLSTGGYDVSNGNTNSGVINQVIKRGSYPAFGQATVRVSSPLYTHELSMDYGDATPNNRFSWYFSFGGQRDGNAYGDMKSFLPDTLNLSTFTDTDDSVANLYYTYGKNNSNQIQFLSDVTSGDFIFGQIMNPLLAPYATANGNVIAGSQIFSDAATGATLPVTASDWTTFFPGQASLNQNIDYVDSQSFNSLIEKVAFKRQLTPSSFVDAYLHRTVENLIFQYPYDTGSFSDFYEDLQTQGNGATFEYDNQLTSAHSLAIGGDYTYFRSEYSAGIPSDEPFFEPLETCYIAGLSAALNTAEANIGQPAYCPSSNTPMTAYASDLSYTDDPVQRQNLWIKDLYQPSDRWTADLGVRFDQQIYRLPGNAAAQNMFYFIDDNGNYVTQPGQSIGADVTRPSQVSPRVAITFKANERNVIRLSYGTNIEFEPESGIENKYRINPALANCTIANGCFTPLPGFGTTNNITNLYQQNIIDQNTNGFAQYTPVRPQRAINADMSIEHDFGGGFELKVSPYYRKGTDYVLGSSTLLLTLPSGTPVFGPSHFSNQGVNENTGVEFDLQREVASGIGGFLNFTYDNTLANYDSDFFPFANAAAVAANHFFHISYIAPITGTLNLTYDSPNGWHTSVTVPYESGYPYGVGKKVYVFENNCDPTKPAIPVQVLNTDLAENNCAGGSTQDAYYFTDPTNPGTVFNPNITGSRGTPDGNDPGTIRGNAIALVNLSISHEIGHEPNNFLAGFRVENLLGNFSGAAPTNNPYYINQGFGGYYSGPFNSSPPCSASTFPSGFNPNQCFEPFMYNLGPQPYYSEANSATPRVWTFFVSAKY
jgi:Carboxypeptidase regulatory-like domain/TonB dependent receptor